MVTNESFDKAWNRYAASGLKPANLLTTEHNAIHILGGVVTFERDFKRMPNPEEMHAVIVYLGDMDGHPPGSLQYHHTYAAPAEALDPRQNIPHLNLFPGCTSVEKATTYVKENSRRIPANQLKQLNELLAYVQAHNIHDNVATEPVETPEQAEQREAYQTIRDRVSALTAKDCGNVGSGPGMGGWERVNKLKKKTLRVSRCVSGAKHFCRNSCRKRGQRCRGPPRFRYSISYEQSVHREGHERINGYSVHHVHACRWACLPASGSVWDSSRHSCAFRIRGNQD